VHHRVKNNMQVISSLLAMQNTGADPQVLRRLEESQNRIRTIALIHEQLYQSTEVSKIDIRSYLNVLATHLLQSFGMSERVALIQDVENVDFDIDQCLACGLIVNELLTNAMKYAFPDNCRGMIRLTLRQNADGSKLLEVRDDGQGLPPPDAVRPSRKTLGTSLIAKLARQLKGKVETDGTNGTTVRIVMSRSEPAPTGNA
jgi:two-component sensor histidine kinase